MKKILILVTFIAFGINTNAQTSILKTSPGALAFGVFNVCYEKVISDKAAFQLSAATYFGIGDLEGTALGFEVGYRRYVTKKEAPRGFYLMPLASATFGDGASAIGIGADLGYQWTWDSGFILDMGFGPNYYFTKGVDVIDELDGIQGRIIFAVGYAW